MKIETEQYKRRTEKYSKLMIADIKKKLDKLYGFHKIETPNGFYITDKNKSGTEYIKLVEYSNNQIKYNKHNSFGSIEDGILVWQKIKKML